MPKELYLGKASPDAMSEVLSQIKELKQNLGEEAQELQKTRYQIESLLNNHAETQYAFYKRIENEQVEMRHIVMSTLERMVQMFERQRMEFEDQMSMMNKQAAEAQEEVLIQLRKHQELQKLSK